MLESAQFRYPRDSAERETSVLIYTKGRRFVLLGSVISLSGNALTFRYLKDGEFPDEPPLLQFLSDSAPDCILKDIPCRIVDDEPLCEKASGFLEFRCCSVRFGKLTKNQKAQLRVLLETRAAADAVFPG